MSNYQEEIDFESRKDAAADNGWSYPRRPISDSEADSWMAYWSAMYEHDDKVACGDKDPGRPVPPHRPGQGISGA